MIFFRSFIFNCAFYLWTAFCTFFALLGMVFGHRPVFYAGYLWGIGTDFFLRTIVGVTQEVRGRENWSGDRPCLMASKHQSLLETTAIRRLCYNSTVIVKRELLWIPFFGQALWAAGVIAIDRSKGKSVRAQLIEGVQYWISRGRSIFIFPEGTRTDPDKKTQIKTGIVNLYEQAGVPVVPVALNTGFFWKRRSFLRYPGRIIYHILEPIEPGLSGEEFLKTLENRLEEGSRALDKETKESLMNPNMKPKNLWVGILLLAGLMGGYGFLWMKGAQIFHRHSISMLKEWEEKGIFVAHTSMAVSGFPFSYKITIEKPTVRVTSLKAFSGELGETLILQASFLDSGKVHVSTQGPVTLHFPFFKEGPFLKASSLKGLYQGPQEQTLSFMGLTVGSFLCEELQIHHDKKEKDPVFSFLLKGFESPLLGLGRIDSLKAVLSLQGTLVWSDPLSMLKTWQASAGAFDLKELSFKMPPFELKAEGTMALDEVFQPAGAFTVRALGLDSLLDKMEKEKILDPHVVKIYRVALSLASFVTGDSSQLTLDSEGKNKDQTPLSLSLSLQKGQVSLGPVSLGAVPLVDWDSFFKALP